MEEETAFWGQLLMVGIPGPRMDPVARELVRDLRVGGVILFARNIESPAQVWELNRDLQQEALAAGKRPLLIAADQEGGTVQRLKTPFTIIPPARELGAAATPEQVERLAQKVARELALVGLNVNLAPVLDVARGPQCPLWDRSYSPDPERVALMGTAAIRGYLTGGVIPTAKHFPGLGDTVIDSHQDLALAESGQTHREMDLLPFRRAAAAGVPMMMTAHLLVPEWDPHRPATLSRKILQGKLREEVGFDGVIITDDLEMGAISRGLEVAPAAREALAAGADLLLICNNFQGAWDAARLLARDESLIPLAREAAARLDRLREGVRVGAADLSEVKEYFSNQ
ncbi:MAG: beta-N-acetylhexosaminidase [Deltaproteobacteria bacterium]|nr:beta-N-acetylhexosaminidase [Deltaproteobacteria bacterium]